MTVISFANMKGGVGKTTLSVNIAYTLANRFKKKVLLIDLDPQFNATQCFFSGEDYIKLRQEGKRTIVDLFIESDQLVPDLVSGAQNPHPPYRLEDIITPFNENLDLIMGDLNLYKIELMQGYGREKKLLRFIEDNNLNESYNYIIIDCPPTPSIWMISGLLASQHYLIPMKPEPLSRYGLDLFSGIVNRVIQNHGHKIDCAGIVLTMTEQNTRVYRDTKEFLSNSQWSEKVFRYELQKRTAIANAQANQELIQELPENKQMIVQLSQEFIRRVVDK